MLKPRIIISTCSISESSNDSIISITRSKFRSSQKSISYAEVSVLTPISAKHDQESSKSDSIQDFPQEATEKTCKCCVF